MSELSDAVTDLDEVIKRLEARNEQLQADYDVLVKISDGYRDEAERLRVITDKYCWTDKDVELALEAGA